MGPHHAPTLRFRQDQGVMVMNGHSTLRRSPGLKSQYQMMFRVISGTLSNLKKDILEIPNSLRERKRPYMSI